MLLETLLVSSDQTAARVLQRVLEELDAKVEQRSNVVEALDRLWRWRFDAVIVDCDISGAATILRELREASQNKNAITFALVPEGISSQEAFSTGAQFILQKPLVSERASRVVRAAHGVIMRERKRYYRHPCHSPVVVIHDITELPAALLNLSRGGVAVRMHTCIKVLEALRLRFTLPGTPILVAPQGEVVWSTRGRAGIRFTSLANGEQHQLEQWLESRFPDAKANGARLAALPQY